MSVLLFGPIGRTPHKIKGQRPQKAPKGPANGPKPIERSKAPTVDQPWDWGSHAGVGTGPSKGRLLIPPRPCEHGPDTQSAPPQKRFCQSLSPAASPPYSRQNPRILSQIGWGWESDWCHLRAKCVENVTVGPTGPQHEKNHTRVRLIPATDSQGEGSDLLQDTPELI